MSATLKIGQFGSRRKSMTCPWNGSGSRTSRSVRLPVMPASSSPKVTAHAVLPHPAGDPQHHHRGDDGERRVRNGV